MRWGRSGRVHFTGLLFTLRLAKPAIAARFGGPDQGHHGFPKQPQEGLTSPRQCSSLPSNNSEPSPRRRSARGCDVGEGWSHIAPSAKRGACDKPTGSRSVFVCRSVVRLVRRTRLVAAGSLAPVCSPRGRPLSLPFAPFRGGQRPPLNRCALTHPALLPSASHRRLSIASPAFRPGRRGSGRLPAQPAHTTRPDGLAG